MPRVNDALVNAQRIGSVIRAPLRWIGGVWMRPVETALMLQGQATRDVVNQQSDATRVAINGEGEASRAVGAQEAQATREVVNQQSQATRDVVDVQIRATRDMISGGNEQILGVLRSLGTDVHRVVTSEMSNASLREQEALGYLGRELRIIRDALEFGPSRYVEDPRPREQGAEWMVADPFLFRALSLADRGASIFVADEEGSRVPLSVRSLGYRVFADTGSEDRREHPNPSNAHQQGFDAAIYRSIEVGRQPGLDELDGGHPLSRVRDLVRPGGLLIAVVPLIGFFDLSALTLALLGWKIESIHFAVAGDHGLWCYAERPPSPVPPFMLGLVVAYRS